VPHNDTILYDRYTIAAYCQHFRQYLTTITGMRRERLAAVRAQLREMAQQHANEIGREVEITFHVTQQRRVWFMPEATPQPPARARP
jgi:hypothetical protein